MIALEVMILLGFLGIYFLHFDSFPPSLLHVLLSLKISRARARITAYMHIARLVVN